MVYEFLDECLNDKEIDLDVFVYDLNEVQIIKSLCDMGSRLRIFMDDTARHTKSTALERQAKAKMKKAKIGGRSLFKSCTQQSTNTKEKRQTD